MNIPPGLIALGLLFAAVYLTQIGAPPRPGRTLIKTAPLICFTLAAAIHGVPAYLLAALALSAAGDLALALAAPSALLYGLAAFGLAHFAYILLFLVLSGHPFWDAFALAPAPAVLLVLLALSTEVWLVPHADKLRWPVRIYVALITAMALGALTLPAVLALTTLGAGLFVLSDMILAVQLFRLPGDAPAHRPAGTAVWVLYITAQTLILAGLLT